MFILYFTVNPFFHISKEHSMHPYFSLPFSNMFCGRYAPQPGTPKHPVPLENTLRKSAKFPFVLFIFDHLTCSGFQYMHCRMSCASKDG